MYRRNIYYIAVIGFIICTGLTLTGKSRFGEDDIKRILYYPAGSSRGMSEFLVLDSVQQFGSLNCRYLGTNRQVSVQPRQVRRMKFFEDSSSFMISQYALYNIFTGQKINRPLQLMRCLGDANNRLQLINIADEVFKKTESAVNNMRNQSLSQDELAEAIIDLLEKNNLDAQFKQAAANRDWLLAITLFATTQSRIKYLTGKLGFKELDQQIARLFADFEKDLLSSFAAQQSIENIRRKNFAQHFPRARSAWSNPVPTNYAALKKLFLTSMHSYFQLERISKIFEPQDWGSAMLNALIMVEGSPGAAALEEEFDNAMRQFANNK